MALKTISTKVNTIKKSELRKNAKVNLAVAHLHNSLRKKLVITKEVASSLLNIIVHRTVKHTNFASNIDYLLPKIMATYYPHYQMQPRYSFPLTMTEWSPVVNTVQSHAYSSPVSVPIVLATNQVVTQICPYTGVIVAEPVLTSIVPSPIVTDLVPVSNVYNEMVNYSPDPTSKVDAIYEQSYHSNEAEPKQNTTEEVNDDPQMDPVEFYLKLPKELFPTARMFSLDPNPIIDEFCKLANISDNTSWILDLEFGIPRAPVTRAIPVYDVQFNSIHCKNTPGAIHPGFESCSYDFKRVFLFYYDCIISTWYKGYIIMNYDKSVKNFQSWLLLPMQIFGMCWP